MLSKCPECGGAVRRPDPARFSPQDRYGRYRRALYDAQAGGVAHPTGPKEEDK
ncbi:MAG: RNA-protein complex protein Nop10 [Thermoplasmata archaeon]|nr:RNA-protein complex protein Nop10 [Thermoplasmata archaeon]